MAITDLHPESQMLVGDDRGDLDDVVGIGLQTGHFQINQINRVEVSGGGTQNYFPVRLVDLLSEACARMRRCPSYQQRLMPTPSVVISFNALVHPALSAFLLLSTAVRSWLVQRQMQSVASHRDEVPAAFASDRPPCAPEGGRLHHRRGATRPWTCCWMPSWSWPDHRGRVQAIDGVATLSLSSLWHAQSLSCRRCY